MSEMSNEVSTIIVPPVLAVLIEQLTERMARVTGENTESTRRAVELSILSRGAAAVQAEIAAGENHAERSGRENA